MDSFLQQRTALLWVITQRVEVIPYRRFFFKGKESVPTAVPIDLIFKGPGFLTL